MALAWTSTTPWDALGDAEALHGAREGHGISVAIAAGHEDAVATGADAPQDA